ncbi:subclass B3 metallo-beta-lactamase [Frateuria defendens]|uniref:subclass B3 metallo-beta-lactamase n=1 Tax=Frateuria defendens TaxID=2219559 RepID=UPI001EFF2DA6|nr:subclass B3 metallo-beta-lactamase [Frateuria defendens]
MAAVRPGAPSSWTQPHTPFRLYGNTWYVGTQGLSAILVTSPQGHVLIDGTATENAAMIEANIRALGFRVEDVRLILDSHAHADHAGAIARLAKDSGAVVGASVAGAKAIEAGGDDPDDPQHGEAPRFPAAAGVRRIADGERVQVGPLALTAHYTPGHTPGSTSWTWQSCERGRCLAMVYADSLTPLSREGFRYGDDARRVAGFRQAIKAVAGLPCDILMTPHPDANGLLDRAAARDRGTQPDPLVDREACRRYAARNAAALDERLAKEHSPPR